jgi:hypothetical protein
MAKKGRYSLHRLVSRDSENKLETWKIMNLKSDNVEVFCNFNTGIYRVFDTIENTVVPFVEIEISPNQ